VMGKMAKFHALLADLRSGVEFDTSFRGRFGADPATLAAAWARNAAYSRK